jgi:pimeloyl-ACP methyl ester carboxylesterase
MRLRKVLAAAGVGLTGTAALNRVLTAHAGPLPPGLDADHRSMRWRGFDVTFAEAGDTDDPDLLLLHGIHAAASNHEFRHVVSALAEDYHVLAPDLPGFGHSDRPAVSYSATLYREFIRDFVDDRTDEPIVIASALTAAHATLAAGEVPVARLILVCPTATSGGRRPWLRTLLRTPLVGRGLFNLLVSKAGLRYYDGKAAYYRPGAVDDALVDYQWRTSHQPNARYAPASFVGGFLDPRADLERELAARECPVTLVWGREAVTPPVESGRQLADEADARLVVIDETRLQPHDEQPRAFLTAVAAELPRFEPA